jgi:hypothetical protein
LEGPRIRLAFRLLSDGIAISVPHRPRHSQVMPPPVLAPRAAAAQLDSVGGLSSNQVLLGPLNHTRHGTVVVVVMSRVLPTLRASWLELLPADAAYGRARSYEFLPSISRFQHMSARYRASGASEVILSVRAPRPSRSRLRMLGSRSGEYVSRSSSVAARAIVGLEGQTADDERLTCKGLSLCIAWIRR